jgi:hypothetical protein
MLQPETSVNDGTAETSALSRREMTGKRKAKVQKRRADADVSEAKAAANTLETRELLRLKTLEGTILHLFLECESN